MSPDAIRAFIEQLEKLLVEYKTRLARLERIADPDPDQKEKK